MVGLSLNVGCSILSLRFDQFMSRVTESAMCMITAANQRGLVRLHGRAQPPNDLHGIAIVK